MGVPEAEALSATDHLLGSVAGLIRSSRRTNYLLIGLTVVLVGLIVVLVSLAIQLGQGNVSLGLVSEQRACGDAQQIADTNAAGVTVVSASANPKLTQEQNQLSSATFSAAENLAADSAGSGSKGFADAARQLAEFYLTGEQSLGGSVATLTAPAQTIYDDCRAAHFPIVSPNGARSLMP